jgi:amino acid transporter
MAVSASPPPDSGQLGERRLGTIHAVAQALAIGPMFSVALVLGGVSRPDIGAGWNATLAVLVAGLGVLAIAYSLSLFARKFAGAGAVYEYLTHGAHPSVGIFTAGIFFVGTLFLGGGGIYLGLGILTNGFWAAHITDASSAPAWWVLGLVAIGIVLVLNYLGVRIAIRAMLTFAAISFIPMLLLALIIIAKGGAHGNTLTMFNPGETSLFGVTGGGVLGGVLLGILLFVGFEAAASIGEESSDPHRSIPRALLWTVGVSGVFFVIMAYAFSIGYGKPKVSAGAWAFSTAPVDEMATQYVGKWFATILDLVVILDATALALAICVTIGRGYFALGRDGLLPKVFAKTSRHNTPWVGNLMVVVGGVGLMLIVHFMNYGTKFVIPTPQGNVPLFPNDEFATFIVSATAGSFVIELVYLILSVVAVRLLVRDNAAWWQYLVVLVAIATPILGFYGALHPSPHDRSNYNWEALYWSLIVLVLSAVWFAICRIMFPDRVRDAASHAAEHHGVAPLDENVDFTPAPPDTII